MMKAVLTPFQIFTLAFGAMIGVAWITLLGQWLAAAGSAGAALGFVFGGAVIALVAVAYAYVARRVRVAGGEAAYAHQILGPAAGFIVGWILAYTYVAISAFLAISIGWIAGALIPGIEGPVLYSMFGVEVRTGTLALALGWTLVIALVQICGAKLAARFQDVMTIAMVLMCLAFIGAGFLRGDPAHLHPLLVRDEAGWPWSGVASVFALMPLIYGGFNLAVQAVGERAPGVTAGAIGTALIASIAAAVAFYVLVIAAASMSAPRELILAAHLPAAEAFRTALNSRALANLVLLAGLLGLLTSWNSVAFAFARLLYALAEQGAVPPVLGRIHPKFGTPHVGLLVGAALTAVASLGGLGAVEPLVGSASLTLAFAYFTVTLCALVIARREADRSGGTLRASALVASLFTFAVALGEPFLARPQWHLPNAWIALALWLVIGIVLHWGAFPRMENQRT